jgi:hypothetical protein
VSSRPAVVQPCPADRQSVRPVRGVYDPGRLDIRQDETRSREDATDLALTTAFELVRTALVAKMAVDLGDPVLARRAVRYAQSSAQLLAGLDFPADVDGDGSDDEALPEVDDLLERMPSRAEVEA